MKYNPDSYLLYGTAKSPRPCFPIRARLTMTETVRADVLDRAVQRAIRRYPYFAVRVEVDAGGGYVLRHNERPIVVCMTRRKTPALGSEIVNGHLAFVDYEGCDIYFNIHYSLTGAVGMYEWIKTTLYEYVSEAYGVHPETTGIRMVGSPLLPGETDFPDVSSLEARAYIPSFTNSEAHHFRSDYIMGALCPFFKQQYYTFDIDQDELLGYARKHGGSPASVLSVLMMKSVDKMLPAKAETIVASIVHNFRDDVGCPDTYRDLMLLLYVPYMRNMAAQPVADLCTVTRKAMAEQMTPANAAAEVNRILDIIEATDALPTLEEKRKYNLIHSRTISQPRSTFTVSYMGRVAWGGLEPYIRSAYTIAEGHVMIEVVNVGSRFCVSFFLVTPGHKYVRSVCQTLDDEGIAYTLHGPFRKNLPEVELPE